MPASSTVARLLRPPWNFEFDYNGLTGDTPILFTAPFTMPAPANGVRDPWTAVDQEAYQNPPPPGISPLLAKMVPVPLASTLLVMFPVVFGPFDAAVPQVAFAYVWRVIFRFRALADFIRRKRNRVPWSIPLSRYGSPDSRVGHPPNRTVSVTGDRVVRPASSESIIHNQPYPAPTAQPPFFGTLLTDSVSIPATVSNVTYPPMYPGWNTDVTPNVITTLDYEQGERDPDLKPPQMRVWRGGPFHLPKFLKATGNEFAVECFKYEIDSTTGRIIQPRAWDFHATANLIDTDAEDFQFSLMMGIGARSLQDGEVPSDTGVRYMTGYYPQ